MKCNIKECYWNMWSPLHETYNNKSSLQCVSEDLDEHYDKNSDFEMIPNSTKCPSYLNYAEFCGVSKYENN